MTIPARNKEDLTYSGVTDLSFYEDVSYNSLTSIRLSLTNIGDTDKILKDCEVFEFYIYVYDAMKKNEEYPYFSINGLKVGDSEETVLEKLGTNYTSKYERNNTTGYQYKIPEEDKFLEVDVSPEFGLYSFTIRQYPKAYVELKENIEDVKIEENIENIEKNLSEENIPEVLPSENWEDMEVVINGNLIDLDNFSYQELTQLIGGRLSDNYNDKTLKSEKQYMMSVWLYEEIDGSVKDSLTVNFYNPSNEEQLLKDCKINLIEQSLSDKEETKDNLIFSKGLTPGLEMSVEDVINLFGEPTEIDESKTYTELIYNAGNKKFIISVKDNKINEITLSFKYEE